MPSFEQMQELNAQAGVTTGKPLREEMDTFFQKAAAEQNREQPEAPKTDTPVTTESVQQSAQATGVDVAQIQKAVQNGQQPTGQPQVQDPTAPAPTPQKKRSPLELIAEVEDPNLQRAMLKSYYESLEPKEQPKPQAPLVPEPEYPKEPNWSERKAKMIADFAKDIVERNTYTEVSDWENPDTGLIEKRSVKKSKFNGETDETVLELARAKAESAILSEKFEHERKIQQLKSEYEQKKAQTVQQREQENFVRRWENDFQSKIEQIVNVGVPLAGDPGRKTSDFFPKTGDREGMVGIFKSLVQGVRNDPAMHRKVAEFSEQYGHGMTPYELSGHIQEMILREAWTKWAPMARLVGNLTQSPQTNDSGSDTAQGRSEQATPAGSPETPKKYPDNLLGSSTGPGDNPNNIGAPTSEKKFTLPRQERPGDPLPPVNKVIDEMFKSLRE